MTLTRASSLDTNPLPPLVGASPFACATLDAWRGRRFGLPPSRPSLEALFQGGGAPWTEAEGLVGAGRAWETHPEWMDFLDPTSPAHDGKARETGIYLHHWAPFLQGGLRVLDLGGGIGRFAKPLLDLDAELILVDADLRSLWRCLWHCAGGPGLLDLRWAFAEDLDTLALGTFDLVLACELLCYCSEPERVLDAIRGVLRPGGFLLASVEAPLGWAAALDAPENSVEVLLSGAPLHVPGDRFVRTWDEPSLRRLLEGWEILSLVGTHYTAGGPLELASSGASLPRLLDWERRLRADPRLSGWHRAWTVVARLRRDLQ